jgi:predicted metal-dependent peptidase
MTSGLPEISASRRISGAIIRLKGNAPFFSVLCLFAEFRETESVPTAATDGRTIFYNPTFVSSLKSRELDGVLLHEVLHAALMHAVRRGTRDPIRWNIAGDVVVNGIVAQQTFVDLPGEAIRAPKLEHLRVEEIYELLDQHSELSHHHPDCLLPGDSDGSDEKSAAARRLLELEEYWKRALRQAEAVARSMQHGHLPAGIDRLLDHLGRPQIDWRSQLWRFLVRTPADFGGFDRRFFSRRLYLDTLESETVRALIAIDTSGSIDASHLDLFLGEVRGILGAYPHLIGELYYADAELYGPFDVGEQVKAPRPVGGGGTSFVPFFRRAAEESFHGEAVCIYLTDGYGTFPSEPPNLPVLWVVTPGGLADAQFPFGDVVRLLKEDT